jgi:hypothetical protein
VPWRATHQAFGALACGALAYAIAKKAGSSNPLVEGVGGAAAGFTASSLPDVLEPASCPSHRAFAHSFAIQILDSLHLRVKELDR